MVGFKITIVVCLLMALAVPYTELLAVSDNSPTYTHFVYMLGHAGWFHWLVNAWTLLIIHNLLRWYRVILAYIVTVSISYVLLPEQPMIGLSVFNCFFIGFAAPWLWRKDRTAALMTVGLLVLTCLMPGFAGVQHIVSLINGIAYCYAEGLIRALKNITSER